ncbi:MAG TPA: carbohydrate porin [Stellaceae bacterium]|nr:carbohydrate porin [Stellaceae bacterium]
MKKISLLALRRRRWVGRVVLGLAVAASIPTLARAQASDPPVSDSVPGSAARRLDLGSVRLAYTPAAPPSSAGGNETMPEWFSIHGQFTNVTQYHPRFASPFRGPNSLDPGNRGNETIDATLFAGIRVWDGLEFYADPEVDQGFGLSNTLGVAGFPSGEAYKVGAAAPYVRLPRAFFRYTWGLGGARQAIEPGANQLAGTRDANNVTLTLGKFSVVDIFDTNAYAHDPRADFLNWSVIESGAFDYAADAWGYTYGGAVEWTQSWWTLRTGLFDLSKVPNGKYLERGFGQFEVVAEAEERHEILAQPGKVKILFFANRGRMANYGDAVRLGQDTGSTPDVSLVRRYRTRPGTALNLEQQIAADVGAFARVSLNDGHPEAYEFTEINRSVAAGFSLKGDRWHRPNDTVGIAGVANDISKDARNYFAAGGLGILIGDGQLPRAGYEKILELYYNASVVDGVNLTVDYQHVDNPAYDAVRGPVDIFGVRVHAEF